MGVWMGVSVWTVETHRKSLDGLFDLCHSNGLTHANTQAGPVLM